MQGGHLLGLCVRRGVRRSLDIDDDDVKRRSLSASIFIFHVVVIKSCSEDTQRHVRVAYFNNNAASLDRFRHELHVSTRASLGPRHHIH